MKVASEVATLSESLGSFHLHTLLALSNIEEAGEGTIYVRLDILPLLDMENGITLAYLTNKNPILELANLFVGAIGILWHCRN